MDGPNHKLNFERGILNARNNLKHIVQYLRFYKEQENYKEFLDVYVPKLEGTEYHAEFKADLAKITKPKKAEKKEEEEVEETGLTEEGFRALPATKQKELIEHLKTEDNNGSTSDKRVALYFS